MDEQLLKRVRREIEAILPEIVDLRHRLHREPELALQEVKTRTAILQALRGAALQYWNPLLGTDVIAELPGRSAETICLRADIDALPMQELNRCEHASSVPGRMHACGHDGHTAILVGAARVLDRLRDELPVSVRFVFQPGEEVVAAGRTLVERGACEGTRAAYALHGWAGFPVGAVCTCAGTMFAAGSFFTITVNGRGAHGAHPERGNNPIPIAARIVERLYQRHLTMNDESGSVISTCAFQGGTNGNIIPETVVLQGTGRYLQTALGDEMEEIIRRTAHDTAAESDATVDIEYTRSYNLPVVNTDAGYRAVRNIAQAALPSGSFVDLNPPTMGNEDFAYYLPGREGAMFFLGLGEESPQGHTPVFDFNDDVIPVGILMFCLLALSEGNGW